MAERKENHVIIVGAGIGGLTLASMCRRLSLTYTILERLPELKPAGAAISLSPQALSVLDQLGLYDQLKIVAQPLTRIKVSQNGNEWNELDWTICEKIFKYPVVTVERAKLMEILYAAAGKETVQLGTVVTDVIEDPEKGVVGVHLADGRILSASIVVGADGIRSVVRRTLARETGDAKSGNTIKFTKRVHMSGWSYPLHGLGQQELGVANWLFYDDSVMMTYGGKDNRQWFIAIRQSDEIPDGDKSVWVGVTPAMIKDVHGKKQHPFAKKTGELGEIVDQAERVLATNIFAEYAYPPMAVGRVALLGDAAHSMSPWFGQGGTACIEDCAELGNALYCIFSESQDVEKSLQVYRTSREKRTQEIAKFSTDFGRFFSAQLPYGVGGIARKLLFGYVPSRAWLWWLKWLYGYQPVLKGLSIAGVHK